MGRLKSIYALIAFLTLSCFAVGDRQQIRAIWLLEGPTFPMDDAVIVAFISKVVNPLTNMPWGSQEQSGGFNYLCDVKLGIDCNSQFPVSGSPDTGSAPDAGSDSGSPEGDSAGGGDAGPDAVPPGAGSGDAGGDYSGTGEYGDVNADYSYDSDYSEYAPPPAPTRRLLQDSGKVYLYLDTTEPSAGAWQEGQVATVIGNLRSLMKSGTFQETFDAASPVPADVTLRFVNAADMPDTPSTAPPTPTPDTPTPTPPEGGAPPTLPWDTPPPTPVPAPTPGSTSGDDVSTSGSSNKTVIIGAVIGGVVGAAILAALVGTCMMRNNRRARDKVNADLMVHRWRREREQAAAAVGKGASGRSPFERSESIRQARAMSGKQMNQEGFRSYRGYNQDSQRGELGLAKSGKGRSMEAAADASAANISPGKVSDLDPMDIEMDNPVLDSSHARSSAPEYPPQEKKKKKFLGMF